VREICLVRYTNKSKATAAGGEQMARQATCPTRKQVRGGGGGAIRGVILSGAAVTAMLVLLLLLLLSGVVTTAESSSSKATRIISRTKEHEEDCGDQSRSDVAAASAAAPAVCSWDDQHHAAVAADHYVLSRQQSRRTSRTTANRHPNAATIVAENDSTRTATASVPPPINNSSSSTPPPPIAAAAVCSIYMAPASAHGNPGYGIYTTRAVPRGEPFLRGGPDVPSIPVLDYEYDDDDDSFPTASHISAPEKKARRHFIDTFSTYWWGHGKPDHVDYLSAQSVDFQLTFGALPNHHCLLDNLDPHYPTTTPYYADRSAVQSPAAGAYSYHGGRVFLADRPVAAGEEIYLNYGHCERVSSSHHNDNATMEWHDYIPMPSDYEEAAQIVHAIFLPAFMERGELPPPDQKSNASSDMVLSLLPTTIAQVQLLIEHGLVLPEEEEEEQDDDDDPERSSQKKNSVMARAIALYTAAARRTPEWIRANGVCVEHLVAQPSTIPYAGQGAFAQHVIRAGEVVVPAPLLQILDRDALRMYDYDDNDDDDNDMVQKYKMDQLLLNYCIGHAESSMLLCPMTNAALINHASGDRTPNAVFQWHKSSEPLWNRTIDEFWSGNGRGLRLDVMALRDIAIGEEVLADYGPAWDTAWQNHLRTNWTGPFRYSTEELNEHEIIPDRFLSHNLRTSYAVGTDDDDSYIITGCQYYVTAEDYEPFDDDYDWRDVEDDAELLRRYSDEEDGWYSDDYEYHEDKAHWPCTVIRLMEESQQQQQQQQNSPQQQQQPRYLVRIHQHPKKRVTAWEAYDVPRSLHDYPRSSIRFFTKPYATDQLLAGSFRHPIGIPDAIFPVAWKNRPPLRTGG
jgi:hypothetical protein